MLLFFFRNEPILEISSTLDDGVTCPKTPTHSDCELICNLDEKCGYWQWYNQNYEDDATKRAVCVLLSDGYSNFMTWEDKDNVYIGGIDMDNKKNQMFKEEIVQDYHKCTFA